MLIAYNPDVELNLEEVGDPVLITEKEEVEREEAKHFINFGDER